MVRSTVGDLLALDVPDVLAPMDESLALVPAVVDAVAPVPVVAAGGIADGRGIAAALVLGAAGAWLGTRFLATVEAPHHPAYKERVLAASETETVYATELFDLGWG